MQEAFREHLRPAVRLLHTRLRGHRHRLPRREPQAHRRREIRDALSAEPVPLHRIPGASCLRRPRLQLEANAGQGNRMKLENTLSIPVPADEAWTVLLDIERIAPCVPGATLTGQDADGYHGKSEGQDRRHRPHVQRHSSNSCRRTRTPRWPSWRPCGREIRGNGTAKALVTCRLVRYGRSHRGVRRDRTRDHRQTRPVRTRCSLAEVSGALIEPVRRQPGG
ncbi:hypothetical protein ACU686_27845 [Yinghuangia aomiensis]